MLGDLRFPGDEDFTRTLVYLEKISVNECREFSKSYLPSRSRWGRDFPPVQTGPRAHPASCTMGTGSVPGVKCGRGVMLTTHTLLLPRPWKSAAVPLPNLWAIPGL